jgi:hypothetical protein
LVVSVSGAPRILLRLAASCTDCGRLARSLLSPLLTHEYPRARQEVQQQLKFKLLSDVDVTSSTLFLPSVPATTCIDVTRYSALPATSDVFSPRPSLSTQNLHLSDLRRLELIEFAFCMDLTYWSAKKNYLHHIIYHTSHCYYQLNCIRLCSIHCTLSSLMATCYYSTSCQCDPLNKNAST